MAGLLVFSTPEHLNQRDRDALEKAQAEKRQNDPVILGIAGYLRQCWDAAKKAKAPINNRILASLRQRNGEYSADQLAKIRQTGGTEVFMMITDVKCRAAEGWLRDILMEEGSPPWDLRPTTIPDLPDNVEADVERVLAEEVLEGVQNLGRPFTAPEMSEMREVINQDLRFALLEEAQNRADRMKHHITDQFEEGGWSEAFDDFISDLVTFPCGFIKGPVIRKQKRMGYVTTSGGQTIVDVEEALVTEYERVDPYRMYPEPGIETLEQGFLFHHHKMSRTDLSGLIGLPGYDDAAIKNILLFGGGQSWVTGDNEGQKESAEGKHSVESTPTDNYDALEFWGKVSGKMLREWGMSEADVPEQTKEYDANVWLIGNYVIKAVLNYDPIGKKPYFKTSFIKSPGSFWGKGIPDVIRDLQGVCNATARALINNIAIASGPQVEVNLDRVNAEEKMNVLYPWKVWQVQDDMTGGSAPAVRFNQPDSRASELSAVYQNFAKLADDHSGIPPYMYGDLNVQGAGRTASGLSMLMGAAGKGIRQVVMHIDKDIVRPVVERQFQHNMRYSAKDDIKGDAQIVAKGAITLATKEGSTARQIEFLNATGNEADMSLIGPEGRASILREVAKGLRLPINDIVPSREAMAMGETFAQAAQAAQPQQLQPDGSQMGGEVSGGVSRGGV